MCVAESHCCPPETITALSTGFAATPKSLQSCPTLRDTMDHIAHQASLSWDSPGKNTGVGCHALL